MGIITATELEKNLEEYLELSSTEDVIIAKNGKIISVLTSPSIRSSALEALDSISAKYPFVDCQEILDERESSR